MPLAPASGTLRVGTSGWHYASWRGPFYPEEIKPKDYLAFYVGQFATTELNNPFYRMPNEATVAAWRESTPPDFLFAWKAPRLISHLKRLKNVEENVPFLMNRARILGGKLGPILVQLPPSLKADRERLGAFLNLLPETQRFTFEFRDPGWYEPAILDLLKAHNAALCFSDHAAAPAPWEATADFVYIRAHGPGGRYEGSYTDATLSQWQAEIDRWRGEGKDVYVYFDNDIKSAAPTDARRLLALTSSEPALPPPESVGRAELSRGALPK